VYELKQAHYLSMYKHLPTLAFPIWQLEWFMM